MRLLNLQAARRARFPGAKRQPRPTERIVSTLFIIVGLINFVPAVGVLSADLLAQAYGIAVPDGGLLILLRHRALLFGVLGSIIVAAAFRRHLQPAAIVAGLAMLGFVIFALVEGEYGMELQKIVLIDVVASAALVVAAFLRRRTGKAPR